MTGAAAISIRSERVLTEAGTRAAEVLVRGGVIAAVTDAGTPRADGCFDPGVEVFELGDCWLAPGFIDLHVHGGGGAQFNSADLDEVLAAARFHARHGTTALLATTVATPVRELEASLHAISRAARSPDGGVIAGVHLEGPFLNPDWPGAMNPSMFLEPNADTLARLLSAAGGIARLVTLAPELPGALGLIRSLTAAGIVASAGHTGATYAQAVEGVRAGVSSATHLFNAMRPLHHREPGAVGAFLECPGVSCELICDGVHVAPAAMALAYALKGAAGITLVTDAIAASGMPDGDYLLGTAPVTVRRGRAVLADATDRPQADATIAGSTLTMDLAVRNAVRWLEVPVEEAVALASANPARLLGLEARKGRIAAGMDADLVVLDDALQACGTMIGGRWIHDPRS